MSEQQLGPIEELNSIYVTDDDRFIVSLIVGYTYDDLVDRDDWSGLDSPREAARWALELTRDEGASGTNWFVYDRATKQMHCFEQKEFDPEMTDISAGPWLPTDDDQA